MLFDDPVPEGRTIAFPDLASLTPAAKGNRYKRVSARLAAFFEFVKAQIGRTDPPYVGGVWVNPVDYERLRAWVEWPLRYVAADVRRRTLSWVWLDSGPSVSRHVPEGQIVVTAAAFQEREP